MSKAQILCSVLSLLLVGCGAQLRKPLCASSETQLPSEFQGYYEVVLPSHSTAWSGNTILKSIHLLLGNNSILGSGMIVAVPSWGGICQIKNRYFITQQNDNGTFGFSEISRFNQGLIISTMSINLEAAKSNNFNLQYVPNFDDAVNGSSQLRFTGIFGDTSFILDNSQLSPDEVIDVSKPISIQTVLRSLPASADFQPTLRAKLTQRGLNKL